MIKVYLDWNVMVGMKANRFPELTEILSDKEKFLIPYSTSHLGDLSSSISNDKKQDETIKDDLDFISKLTDNFCLFNSLETTVLEIRSPNEIFEQQKSNSKLSFEEILEVDDEESIDLMNKYKEILKSIPLDELLDESFISKENVDNINKLFPHLYNDKTLYGFMNSMFDLYKNLNDTDLYKDIRKIVQQLGINNSHFNPHKNPFEIIENTLAKHNISDSDYTKYFKDSKSVPLWFADIINQYITLDMYGYKSDNIKVTEKKKQTFKNTTDDASHSAFASICNIYITNDDKNYHKTKTAYKKLNIKTKVFKPNEFINFYEINLKNSTVSDFFNELIDLLHEPIFHNTNNEDGTYFGHVALLDKYLFNLFNKIYVPKSDTEGIYVILSIDYPNDNFQLTGYKEIECLIKSFYDLFGKDLYENELFSNKDIEEINTDVWIGRKWNTNIGSISIIRLNSYIQLYYDYSIINQST